jgi:hypothetical protein
MPVVIGLAVLFYARRLQFDNLSILLVIVALGLYYVHFYHTRWDEFAIDAQSHAGYVEYIAEHSQLPPVHFNSATRHPPFFYIVSAVFYKFGQLEHMQDPLLMARHFSMLCFMGFILLSTCLLRLLLPNESEGYYAALLLLLFWPIGVTMGSRITCDILLYASEAGVLYGLVKWLLAKDVKYLSAAFLWSGVAVLSKSPGIIMLGIASCVLITALYEQRRNCAIFIKAHLASAILFALLCCCLTFMHERGVWTPASVITEHTVFADTHVKLDTFYGFNVFLFLFDNSMGLSKESFWNMLLHSLMLGNGAMLWKAEYIPIIFNILWVAIILYFLEGALQYRRKLMPGNGIFVLLGLFLFLMVLSMMIMRVRVNNVEYSDARYIYPVVAIIALCHGRVTQCHKEHGNMRAYKTGLAIAGCFWACSLGLFLFQYV